MSKPERVIFLDIDGVICCNMVGHLEENKLAELKRIVDETGAKVLLSLLAARCHVRPVIRPYMCTYITR
jgi:hypothetical protein